MSSAEKILNPILHVIRHQKKAIAVALISAVVFAILFFPYEDLSDLISEQIAKATQNQVFVQFEDLGIGFFPPSIKMTKVEVDTPVLPTLKAGALRIAPSIAGLLAFSPGFSASIDDVMSGKIHLSYRGGKKVNESTQMQKVSLSLSSLELKKMSSYAGLPCMMEGPFSADADTQIDPQFVEQPEGEYSLSTGKFHLNPCVLTIQRLPFPLPMLDISSMKIKGEIKAGRLTITEGQIGKTGDTIYGRFKGTMGLRLSMQGRQILPQISNYEFKIDLNIDRSAEKSLGTYLSFYDSYKSLTGTGSRYALTLSAPNTFVPPNASPLGSF